MIKIRNLSLVVIFLSLFTVYLRLKDQVSTPNSGDVNQVTKYTPIPTETPTPTPTITLTQPPLQKVLQNDYHIFQTFNNCGPASLSMALSYYGIKISQQELGNQLRPYQIASGDNDDKSVTLSELATKAKEYGFVPYHRPNGNFELIKYFIAYDIPIITRTWTKPNEDIGHYRVVKGFDELTDEIIQDDSLQGNNLRFAIDYFNQMWGKFNYEYLVLIPNDKIDIVNAILKSESNPTTSWTKAAENAKVQLAHNPEDVYARFNLSVALYNIGDYQGSVKEFEQVEPKLPFRTLWYQTEPILAYYETGNYERVIAITDKILNNHNRAFSELYIVRGKIYQKQGRTDLARQEFEKAVFYSKLKTK